MRLRTVSSGWCWALEGSTVQRHAIDRATSDRDVIRRLGRHGAKAGNISIWDRCRRREGSGSVALKVAGERGRPGAAFGNAERTADIAQREVCFVNINGWIAGDAIAIGDSDLGRAGRQRPPGDSVGNSSDDEAVRAMIPLAARL